MERAGGALNINCDEEEILLSEDMYSNKQLIETAK